MITSNNILTLYESCGIDIVSAKDCILYGKDGRQYVDFESGVWCSNIGHCNERIGSVIRKQCSQSIHLGYPFTHDLPGRLAARMLELLHMPEGKCVFLSSGSEAVNLAIIFARTITGRKKILTVEHTYLSAYGHAGNLADNPNSELVPLNDLNAIKKIRFRDVAAFVFEPGTSGGQVHFPSGEFIDSLVQAARKNGACVIVDEVTTGFGRTGKWFGFQHYDLKPDMVVCGKGMGNGYPVSAVSVSTDMTHRIEQTGMHYAQSHQNDPLGCAIALEVINILGEDDLVRKCRESGKLFRELLDVLAEKFTQIIDVRSRGLMLAIEFGQETDTGHLFNQLLKNGFVVGKKNNVLRFMPPLTVKESDIIRLVKCMEEIVSRES